MLNSIKYQLDILKSVAAHRLYFLLACIFPLLVISELAVVSVLANLISLLFQGKLVWNFSNFFDEVMELKNLTIFLIVCLLAAQIATFICKISFKYVLESINEVISLKAAKKLSDWENEWLKTRNITPSKGVTIVTRYVTNFTNGVLPGFLGLLIDSVSLTSIILMVSILQSPKILIIVPFAILVVVILDFITKNVSPTLVRERTTFTNNC